MINTEKNYATKKECQEKNWNWNLNIYNSTGENIIEPVEKQLGTKNLSFIP